jgi:hypothetical protein
VQEGGKQRMTEWAKETNMDVDSSVVVVKPADGTAGIGVSMEKGADAAIATAASLLTQKMTTQVIIEPKLLGAIEFSVSVVQTPTGVYALPPTSFEFVDYELDIRKAERDLKVKKMQRQEGYFEHVELFDDEEADSLLTYSRKQLPCDTLREHTPALLPVTAVQVCSCWHAGRSPLLPLGLWSAGSCATFFDAFSCSSPALSAFFTRRKCLDASYRTVLVPHSMLGAQRHCSTSKRLCCRPSGGVQSVPSWSLASATVPALTAGQ